MNDNDNKKDSQIHSADTSENKSHNRLENTKQLGPIILVTQLGLSMAGSILFCLLIGFYLDKWLHTKPVFIIIFILLGVIGGGYNAYRQIMESMKLNEKDHNSFRTPQSSSRSRRIEGDKDRNHNQFEFSRIGRFDPAQRPGSPLHRIGA